MTTSFEIHENHDQKTKTYIFQNKTSQQSMSFENLKFTSQFKIAFFTMLIAHFFGFWVPPKAYVKKIHQKL